MHPDDPDKTDKTTAFPQPTKLFCIPCKSLGMQK